MNKTIKIAVLTVAALATPSALACHFCSGIIQPNNNDIPFTQLHFLYIGTISQLQETDDNGWTMLHWAVEAAAETQTSLKPLAFEAHRENLLRGARVYLQKRADPGVKNDAGETALMRAVFYNDAEMVDIILGNMPLTADDFITQSAKDRFNDEQDAYNRRSPNSPDPGANPNSVNKGDTALMYAAKYADFAIVENLINHGANVNATDNDGNTALFHFAPRINDNDIGRLLVNSPGINITIVNNAGQNILEHVVNHNNVNLMSHIISVNADNDNLFNYQSEDGNTPLILAAQLGRTQMVDLLINRTNIFANLRNKRDRNAIIEAAYFGHTDILRLIHERYNLSENSINQQDDTGATALLAAADRKHHAVLKYLLDIGADPNIRQCNTIVLVFCNGTGNTPMLYAIKNRDSSSARDLLLADADLDLANEDGITPLILAASMGNFALVSGLLNNRSNNRANPFIADDNGLTALAHARSQNTDDHRRIVDLLYEHIRGLQ